MNQNLEQINLIPIRSNMINQLKNIQDILIDIDYIDISESESDYIKSIEILINGLIKEVTKKQIKQIDWKPSIINRIKAGD